MTGSFDRVAKEPVVGDVVFMRGGTVTYVVVSGSVLTVCTKRKQVRRDGVEKELLVAMDRAAWQDLVLFGASSVNEGVRSPGPDAESSKERTA